MEESAGPSRIASPGGDGAALESMVLSTSWTGFVSSWEPLKGRVLLVTKYKTQISIQMNEAVSLYINKPQAHVMDT